MPEFKDAKQNMVRIKVEDPEKSLIPHLMCNPLE